MAQRAHIPKFGNWEKAGSAPYTAYFDNARKGKTGKMINPNDPEENPDAFSEETSPFQGSPVRTAPNPENPKQKHDRRPSKEERVIGSPLRQDGAARKYSLDSPQHRYGEQVNSGEPPRRASRQSAGSERSIEQSPLHPNYHAKTASKGGVASPSWERKGSSEGHVHGSNTPGRSKMRPSSRDDDISEKGSTVPKFGGWNEGDPASADGYTHIFSVLSEEKKTGATKSPVIPNTNGHNRANNTDSVGCWCFSFGKN